mmetsp:Transcript_33238/g.50970  ORF Transcript_33238/g.50970 Transcript_33238/m.50970 type:complete len:96 (-) Transcript_33238:718-1005(-)
MKRNNLGGILTKEEQKQQKEEAANAVNHKQHNSVISSLIQAITPLLHELHLSATATSYMKYIHEKYRGKTAEEIEEYFSGLDTTSDRYIQELYSL